MLYRNHAPTARDFHLINLCDGAVVGTEIVHCAGEEAAFRRAEDLLASSARPDASVLVLDHEQAFVGSISRPAMHWRHAA